MLSLTCKPSARIRSRAETEDDCSQSHLICDFVRQPPTRASALDDLNVFTSTSRVSHRCKLMQTDTNSDAIVAFGKRWRDAAKQEMPWENKNRPRFQLCINNLSNRFNTEIKLQSHLWPYSSMMSGHSALTAAPPASRCTLSSSGADCVKLTVP